ncbi:MAG: ABC transporter ATP-binding protein [Nitriliruptor sp.]|nr:MAG: ABC transporter ATP-binding protein [Nitriliruptor sp.]
MLEIEHLTLAYDDTVVVEDLALTAADGEVLCVLGPSGCGKSTLLRAVAGLEPPVTGTIHLDGRDLAGLRPDQRDVGLMFQEHALFPHRNVAENVAFGPRVHGLERDAVRQRVAEALSLVGLSGTEFRHVDELSGGERQRVALARAIAPRPRLLMLDEPLGSLDRALQTRLLEDLPRVLSQLGTTVVYVTHDQDEALSLADRIAVMRAGRIEQQDTPAELWRGPRTAFVARFLGLGPVMAVQADADTVTTPWGRVPRAEVSDAGAGTGTVEAVLLPEALRLAPGHQPPGDDELAVTATVATRRFQGDHLRLGVDTERGQRLQVAAWRGELPDVGDEVTLGIEVAGIHLLADDPAG